LKANYCKDLKWTKLYRQERGLIIEILSLGRVIWIRLSTKTCLSILFWAIQIIFQLTKCIQTVYFATKPSNLYIILRTRTICNSSSSWHWHKYMGSSVIWATAARLSKGYRVVRSSRGGKSIMGLAWRTIIITKCHSSISSSLRLLRAQNWETRGYPPSNVCSLEVESSSKVHQVRAAIRYCNWRLITCLAPSTQTVNIYYIK
jgi:hypothetical protein